MEIKEEEMRDEKGFMREQRNRDMTSRYSLTKESQLVVSRISDDIYVTLLKNHSWIGVHQLLV